MQSPSPVFQPGGDIELHFSVSDTGIGISPEKLPYIFDAFVQEDTSTTRKYGGTGLGLTITSRLVEMMGGDLWAESGPGEGSTFHFTLRLKLQDCSPSRLLPRKPLDLQGMTVLVVDDNATNQRILAELLSSWLMKPTTVDNAQRGLEELEAAAVAGKPFPLVLLDAHMPGEDGLTLAGEIRARPSLREPELILLSSTNRAGDSEKCRDLRIRQRLTKPIKPSDLVRAILGTLDAQGARPQGDPGNELSARGPTGGALVAVAAAPSEQCGLSLLLAEDNLVNQRLMLAVLEKQKHRVTVVANGAAAVRAVQQEAFDVVLMDVQMPEMNGLEATRAIRAWEQQSGGHVPIIAMTAHAMKGAREDCLRAGMDEYLSKPVQVPELVRVMAALTNGQSEQATTADAEQPVQFDPRPLIQRLGDDDELVRELIHLFQDDGPRMLETIRAAVDSEDAESVERTAHLLKGSASNFAAKEVVQAAQHLEDLGRRGDLREARAAYDTLEHSLTRFCAALDDWLAVHPTVT